VRVEINNMEKYISRGYEALMSCVRFALRERNSDLAVIFGLPLVKMASAEAGAYIEDYNEAMDLGVAVVKLAEKKGVSPWLHDDLEELKETLREAGWEVW